MIKRCFASALTALCLTLPLYAKAGGEFATERQALVQATAALFDRIEARSAPATQTPAITSPRASVHLKITADSSEADSLTRMGPVDHLTGYRITWYPMEHLRGTVDFMGTWDGTRNLVCGYVTWDLTDPEAPKLESLSASFVDLTKFSGASERQMHSNLIEANCAYGAVDANYRVFDPAG